MSASYVLGIDMGTESVRVGVYDTHGTPLTLAASPYKTTHLHLVGLSKTQTSGGHHL